MNRVTFKRKVIWSDSKVALAQCEARTNKRIFVHNRVIKIRELCKDFEIRYVLSKENPADYTTKAIATRRLRNSELWKKGPEWITNKNRWNNEEKYNLFPEVIENEIEWDTEACQTYCYKAQFNNDGQEFGKIWTNTYRGTIMLFAIVERWKKKAKNIQCENNPIIEMSRDEFVRAERKAIRKMQQECFQEEITTLKKGKRQKKSSKYAQSKIYFDEHGIIRTQGRLKDTSFIRFNTPILFGFKHPFTIAYIKYKHNCWNHSSQNYTLNIIRREIHSIKLRKQIREVTNKCVLCKKSSRKTFFISRKSSIRYLQNTM